MKFILIAITCVTGILVFRGTSTGRPPAPVPAISTPPSLRSKAIEAKQFVADNKFNQQIAFLLDFSVPSSQPRFYVYDLVRDTVINTGLVTHGRCNQLWLEGRKYGNTVGCGCSSLGKYKVGKKYKGRFGQAYKLHGLEATNDKAFDRYVVLHSHECVPESPEGSEICQSDGCPTVSINFLSYLQPVIDRSPKPILLWIFE